MSRQKTDQNPEQKTEEILEKITENDNEQQEQTTAKKASLAIFLLIIVMFMAVIFLTDFIELKFGKTVGTAALVIIAAAIAVILYRKEIANWFRAKKDKKS